MDLINEALLNPVRMRIVQYLATHDRVTAGELAAFMTDIPRTTLYRHLSRLADVNILTVVDENRIRGTAEKVYALNRSTLSSENTIENGTRNAFSFLMKIYADFHTYFSGSHADPGKDRIFLNNVILMMSDDEYDRFLIQLGEHIAQYLQQGPSDGRRPRNLSIISAPSIE